MDCDDSLCMDPQKLRRFCENECVTEDGQLKHKATGKTVKAIVVVHVFGNMADMEAIMDIAQEFHLKVIEDATEALGTQYTKGVMPENLPELLAILGRILLMETRLLQPVAAVL